MTSSFAPSKRDAVDDWTEAAPSAEAVAAAIADYERKAARLRGKAAFLRWFQGWREFYWSERHRDLREAGRDARRRTLEEQRVAEDLSEWAEHLLEPSPLLLPAGRDGDEGAASQRLA